MEHAMNRALITLLLLFCAGRIVAGDRTVISGHVTGSDGRPLPRAHVSILQRGNTFPAAVVEVRPDGSFTIATDLTGPLTLRATGVSHAPHEVTILAETPRLITLDISLAPRLTAKSLDGVKIIGDYNDWNPMTARPFDRRPDGTYEATIDVSFAPFGYMLLLNDSQGNTFSMNGTQADSFAYDGDGGYKSVVGGTGGSVTIHLDPSKLPAAMKSAAVIYGDSVTARIAATLEGIERRREEVMPEMTSAMKAGRAFTHDWSAEMRELTDGARREKSPLVRNALLLAYLDLAARGGAPADRKAARAVLADLPPGSILWRYDPRLLEAAIAGTGTPAAYDAYRWKMVESRPDTSSRIDALLTCINYARMKRDTDLLGRYTTYITEHFPKTGAAKLVRYEYSPYRAVMVGKPIPHFSLPSLDDTSEIVSDELMKGRFYLIDFWATWCGPCVGEMENLHKAYESYHGRNFEIVSISFDAHPGDVARYRRGKWKMPWRNVFVDGSFQSMIAERFEVGGIPKAILVDATGRIVAVGDELRGDDLDKTLRRVFGGMN
jgi:thiol-disulfide isomerase/thioredoxin